MNPVRKLHIFRPSLLLVGVLLLAAFMRLYRISEYMTFLGDEGRDVLVAYNILHGKLTLLGPTASVGGFFLGPIYYYFMAPFLYLFNYDPAGPAVMVALFGIATVYLVYVMGKEFFNEKVGLLSALLYAISPLVIAYSRSSWNPNLMPFFTSLTLFVVFKTVTQEKKKFFWVAGFFLGILMQLHYLATFVGVIIATYVLLMRLTARTKQDISIVPILFKDFTFLFLGFIVGWSPFLVFEFRHGFPNLQSIFQFVFSLEDTGMSGSFSSTLWNIFFRLFARLVTMFPPLEQVSLQSSSTIAMWYWSTVVLGLVSVGIFLKRFADSVQKKDTRFQKLSLLALWFFLGIFLFGFYKKPVYDYYLGFMFPLPFLLVGAALSSLWRTTLLRVVAIGAFVFLVWMNGQGIPFRFTPNRQKDQVKTIADFVLTKTNGKPFNFALVTGGNSDHAYRYFFTLAKRYPVTILNPQVDPKRESVTDQLFVVCEMVPCAPLGNPLWEVAGFGRAEVVGRWHVSVVEVYKLVHYKGD